MLKGIFYCWADSIDVVYNDMEEKLLRVSSSTYFKLIEAVGVSGNYQNLIIVFSFIICFLNGIISSGTPYYFAVAPYTNCPPPNTGITQCTAYACSLPENQRQPFLQPEINELTTLGTQFGDYHCQKSDEIDSIKGIYYFGGMAGYVISGPMMDNLGRRIGIIISLSLNVFSLLLIIFAVNLEMVGAGMFGLGIGIDNCFNIALVIMTEVLQNSLRQKMAIVYQAFFPIGGIFLILVFYLLKRWKIIFILFLLTPMAICLIFAYFFVQETPQFLIKRYTPEEIRSSLRFMAKINKQRWSFEENRAVSEPNLSEMARIYDECNEKSNKKIFTYLDLFRYASLKKITICTALMFFSINFLYYAPLMLISQFGLDFYMNGVIVNLSDLVTYPFSYYFILNLKRRKFNVFASIVAFACSFALVFLYTNEICTQNCWTFRVIIQLLVVFIMRFFVSLVFQILYLYATELYPSQVVGLGVGFGCLVGCTPAMLIPVLINVFNRINFPVMTIFCAASFLSLVNSFLLPETEGRQPKDKVQEIENCQVVREGVEMAENVDYDHEH